MPRIIGSVFAAWVSQRTRVRCHLRREGAQRTSAGHLLAVLMVGTDFGVWVVRAIGRPAMIPHALFGIGQITLAQDFSAYIAGIEGTGH
jgi:hypothetical protein